MSPTQVKAPSAFKNEGHDPSVVRPKVSSEPSSCKTIIQLSEPQINEKLCPRSIMWTAYLSTVATTFATLRCWNNRATRVDHEALFISASSVGKPSLKSSGSTSNIQVIINDINKRVTHHQAKGLQPFEKQHNSMTVDTYKNAFLERDAHV
jgi:hypothetical protein